MMKKTHDTSSTYRHDQKIYSDFDEHNFSIHPLHDMRIIDSYEGLDDECEFEKNMFNFGDFEDLPESDRATDRRCKP